MEKEIEIVVDVETTGLDYTKESRGTRRWDRRSPGCSTSRACGDRQRCHGRKSWSARHTARHWRDQPGA